MSSWLFYAAAGIAMFGVGFFGASSPRSAAVRRILAINIMASGVFLVLVAIAHRAPRTPPDPVPHALVLTGIVVSVSGTALALALARRIVERRGGRRSNG